MTSTPSTTNAPPTHPAYNLLTRTHPPTLATEIFTNKIKNKPLLLTPSTKTTDSRAHRRHLRTRKSQYHIQHARPRPLSSREKRGLNLHTLPTSELKFSVFAGLNELWAGYIHEVLGFTRDGEVVEDVDRRAVTHASSGSLLASADFHGMEIEVVRCGDVGMVGVKGFVVRETKGLLVVVMSGDIVRRVVKRGAVFRVRVKLPGGDAGEERVLVFDLHGSQLEVRPVDRAVKKFKWHAKDYL